ncbi:GFA family protein [Marinicella sediminis]|uniref:GFA family protein n=1 Tax=Marinicella sediminis TaxID=1792834 RepID=A0ABV7J9L8_9GAMM|nr:GFA family protein [Marinicella sediminis]
MTQAKHQGSCLCGSVKFTVDGELGAGDMCHCQQCRLWTGHVYASTEVKRSALHFDSKETLKWFESSGKVRRGFCGACGSPMFFDPMDHQQHDWIGIALGSFTNATGVDIERHIFTAEKGDYYIIADGAPQHDY